ncbi:MAG TPA: C39 family peptidase [Candidatus Paceibacterota bacterium]
MKSQVPYYSQFKDVKNKELMEKSCTLTCLKMGLDYFLNEETPSIDDLFEEASLIAKDMERKGTIGKHSLDHGLTHDIIVLLAHNHYLQAYREEFKSVNVDLKKRIFTPNKFKDEMLEVGIQKIIASLINGHLIIASVLPGLSRGLSFHTILIIGFREVNKEPIGFIYHDPDSKDAMRSNQFIDLDSFKKFWRKQAIFIHS